MERLTSNKPVEEMSMVENENNLLEYYERTIQECVKQCDGFCSLRDKECECVDANVLDHLKELQAYRAIGTIEEFKALKEKSADIEKIIESINQLPTQNFMGVLHIPRTATINRIKRGGNCELPEV